MRHPTSWARLGFSALLLTASCGAHPNTPAEPACDGPCPSSNIQHVVVIVQENHTFDSYFGRYCTAPTDSNPTCTSGPACCEAGPDKEPGTGGAPTVLTDAETAAFNPNHHQSCEVEEIDSGKMDKFVNNADCGSARNFGYADPALVQPYWQLAGTSALADRYFQPVAGESVSNDMYLARAGFVFKDNDDYPDAQGKECAGASNVKSFTDETIGDLLGKGGVSWAWYGEGYQAMLDARANEMCPDAPKDCSLGLPIYPCIYDASDVPFLFYPNFRNNPAAMRDLAALGSDIAASKLPQVSFVKGLGYHSEHPGGGTTISAGVSFVTSVVKLLQDSKYASKTLILLTYDEGGGYFDHVAPPAASTVDMQPYGTRIPLIAIGPFARRNFVSHVTLEHSSIVKFIEWNWLGGQTGQLGTRDAVVNNLGSLLDPALTGKAVPEK